MWLGQDADLTRGGSGEQERALARPNLPVDRDDVDVQFRHVTPPFARRRRSQLRAEALGLLRQVVKAADQEERLLGQMVEVALGELVKGLDRLLQRNRRTGLTGELLGGHHVLRQEPLDAAGSLAPAACPLRTARRYRGSR